MNTQLWRVKYGKKQALWRGYLNTSDSYCHAFNHDFAVAVEGHKQHNVNKSKLFTLSKESRLGIYYFFLAETNQPEDQ